MPIAEIINEIDVYLSRLRQAREVLLGRITEIPQERLPRRKWTVPVRQADKTSSSRRQADGNKPRSKPAVAHRKREKERCDPAAEVLTGAPLQSSDTERPATVAPQRTMSQDIVITRLPARRRTSSNRPVHHRIKTTELATKPDAIRPAIALAGPMNTKVVVVSAEQAQRERERALPEVRRSRISVSGLSGRRAFEALFKDESDPSKAHTQ